MKNAVARFGFLFALAASLAAEGAATNGNCMNAAVRMTPSSSPQTVTLVREWNPYGGPNGTGDWSDGGYQEEAIGVKWFYADLTKGKNYVIWMDETGVGYDDLLNMNIEVDDTASAPDSQFAYYPDANGTVFRYMTKEIGDEEGQWSPGDPETCRFYICFSDNDVGKSAKLYFKEEAIASHAPAGSKLNPININVSGDGSLNVIKVPDEDTHYTFTAETGYHYVFTCSSNPTNMPIISLDAVRGNEEFVNEDARSDSTTGTYIYDFSITNGSMTAVITVSADEPALCTLSWTRSEVGTAGFAATAVEVRADAGYANLEVFRTSADSAMRYVWMTVAETAVPGVDYIPASEELVFEENGEKSAIINIPLIPGGDPEAGAKVFAVRLVQVHEHDLGEDEYSPPPNPAVVRVTIMPTGASEPEPEIPEAIDEDEDTALSTGTFEGVLTSGDGASHFAETRLSSSNGTLSATIILDGHAYSLAGSGNMLSGSMTVCGTPFDAALNFVPPSGTVADLYDGPGGAASVSGFLYVEVQGAAEEVFFSGNLYRVESRRDTATLDAMADTAGRYVTALGADWQPGVTDTNGYLVVDVAVDGSATVSGELPDGTAIAYAGYANDTTNGLALPIAWRSGNAAIGGTLMLDGKYDCWSSLDRLYSGWVLVVNDAESPFEGLELHAENETFLAADMATTISFDRASGVISGVKNGNSFKAVLLTAAQANEAGAAGFATDGSGKVVPFVLQRVWTDPDWSEDWGVEVTVSFNANGGTGSMADMHATLVQTIELPPCAFTKVNNRFAGWRHPYSGIIYQPGDVINVPVTDSSFLAVWEDVRIKTALDCDNLVFSCDDEANWDVVSAAYATGGTYVRSTTSLTGDGEFTISTTVDSAGTLTFDWGLVRRVYYVGGTKPDTFALVVDGETVLELSGADHTSFVPEKYEIKGSGAHNITWKYVRSDKTGFYTQNPSVDARVMLDAVVWAPDIQSGVLVTFDAGEYGVSSVTNVYLPAGEPIGPLPAARRQGCEFMGWFNSRDVAVTESTLVPKRGLALHAKWSATASFGANGAITGSIPAPVTVEAGETITLPGALTNVLEDFEFIGWRLGDVVYDVGASSDPIMSNVTFIAEWQDNRPVVTVTLDPNGGACAETNIVVKAGDEIGMLPTPTLDDAVFVAWYEGAERVTLPYVAGRTNSTLTAHWGVTLTFAGGGATGTPPADIAAEPGDSVPLPGCGGFVLENHAFVGWTDGEGRYREGDLYTVTKSTTLTAIWKNAFYNGPLDNSALEFSSNDDASWTIVSDASASGGTYLRSVASLGDGTFTISTTVDSAGTLTFDWGLVRRQYYVGGTKPDTFALVVDGETVLELSGADYPSFTHAEYEILEPGAHSIAWKYVRSDKAGYYTQNANIDAKAMLDAVVWEPQDTSRVLVTFDAGEHGVSDVTNVYLTAGEPFGTLPTATRDGCDFVGWFDSEDTEITAVSIVPENGCTLFAKWSATASFDGNGDISGDVPAPVTVAPGETITLPAALTHVSVDFEFIGWRLGDDVYDAGASSDPITSNVTFVAEWKAPTVTITLDANGGNCGETSVVVQAGDAIDSLPTPTMDGAVFVAWYEGGERVTLPYVAGRTNTTFTAHWGVTLTFADGGATGEVPADIAAEPGDTVTLPSGDGLALADYTFAGWNDGNGIYKGGALYEVTASATLTAVWKNAFYNGPLDNDELVFSSNNDNGWTVVSDVSATGGTYLRSVASLGDGTFTISTTVDSAGTLTFDWGLVRRQYYVGGIKPDTFALVVDGETVRELSGADYSSFTNAEYEILEPGTHTIAWKYVRSDKTGFYTQNANIKAWAMLDAVEWTPSGISTDPGMPFAGAGEKELAKATAWMEANGLSAADMNALKFSGGNSGDPLDDISAAYLLDCAPTSEAIAAAKAAFKVTSFSVGADGEIAITPDESYGNGRVVPFYATSPGGSYSAEKPEPASSLFIRLHLVK